MSLQWRNELRLSLGPRHCSGAVWAAGIRPRQLGAAQVSGGDALLDRVLGELVGQGIDLPQQASVCLGDELLYYALLPADGPWREVESRAMAHFSDALGQDSLLVGAALTPCGRRWLAVAAEGPRIEDINEVLAERGVGLHRVTAELLDELGRIGRDAPSDGVLVMLRHQGAMLLAMQAGSVIDLTWERMDLQATASVRARVLAYAERTALSGEGGQTDVLLVSRMGEPVAHLAELAKAESWRHLSLLGSAAGGMVPAAVE